MISPGKKAWLARKALREQKRRAEQIQLTKEGQTKTGYFGDVKTILATDLVRLIVKEMQIAGELGVTRDKKGVFTTAKLDAYRHELVRRGRKVLRSKKQEVPTTPQLMKFWVAVYDPAFAEEQSYLLSDFYDNTDVK